MKGPWGTRRIEVSAGDDAQNLPPKLAESQAACEQCGAVLAFEPGTEQVRCDYCDASNQIDISPVEIVEHDLRAGFKEAELDNLSETAAAVSCDACQAVFTFDADHHAGECPFCGHAIVQDTGQHKQIKPAAILPFAISETQSRQAMQTWLGRLWFAPSQLHKLARTGGRIHGMYLPYWTFDSHVSATYRGQRGDVYLEPQRVSVMVNGKRRTETRMVQKVRWRPARGRVHRYFNDVLVLASHSLPKWMAKRLGPWDLSGLKPYTPLFIQGFQSQSYNLPLDQGFSQAETIMKSRIKADIRVDIGGDLQKINSINLNHSETSFKHILLPLWLGVYRYAGKPYHVSINGQTGEVQGERPYSWVKLAAAGLVVLLLLGVVGYVYGGGDF